MRRKGTTIPADYLTASSESESSDKRISSMQGKGAAMPCGQIKRRKPH